MANTRVKVMVTEFDDPAQDGKTLHYFSVPANSGRKNFSKFGCDVGPYASKGECANDARRRGFLPVDVDGKVVQRR